MVPMEINRPELLELAQRVWDTFWAVAVHEDWRVCQATQPTYSGLRVAVGGIFAELLGDLELGASPDELTPADRLYTHLVETGEGDDLARAVAEIGKLERAELEAEVSA